MVGARELLGMLRSLLEDANGERRYWDRFDCLNSDGRRLLHSVTKAALELYPWLRRVVYEARREPCRDNVERLYEAIARYSRVA